MTLKTALIIALLLLLAVGLVLAVAAGLNKVNGSFLMQPNPAQITPSTTEAPHTPSPEFTVVTVMEGLEYPWSLAFPPQGGMLMTEKPGRLTYIPNPDAPPIHISGLPDDIYYAGQAGLFEVLLAPDFSQSGTVFLSYSSKQGRGTVLKVTRATLTLDNKSGRLTEVETIFTSTPPVADNKNLGGKMLFLPDGTLLVSVGDFFEQDEAQNLNNHLGTVVRLNPDGSVPANNPFVGREDARPEIFTYGNRNIQGMVLHPENGAIWSHEHGPKGGDEVNILTSGANYAWPLATFGIDYSGATITDRTTYPDTVDPLIHWTPSIAPSGMTFVTGDRFPGWQGDILLGALAGQHLRRLNIENGQIVGQEELLTDMDTRIREVRQGPHGDIYILTDERNGRLIRLEPAH